MQQIAFAAVIWQCCRLCYLFSRSFIPDNMHSLLAFNHPRLERRRLAECCSDSGSQSSNL